MEHEDLDGEVRINVVLAHEGDHLAIEVALHQRDEVGPHHGLVVVAQGENAFGAVRPVVPPGVQPPAWFGARNAERDAAFAERLALEPAGDGS